MLLYRINYEHVRDERDRLRINICEANARADLLAQEVDDQNAKQEASSQTKLMWVYQTQLKCWTNLGWHDQDHHIDTIDVCADLTACQLLIDARSDVLCDKLS